LTKDGEATIKPKFQVMVFWVNYELHDLYSSPNIVRMIKARRMRWAGHVARMGRGEVPTGFWFGGPKARDHWEDLGVGGSITLRWTLGR
jgi:hypothetical protein